ncbi:hypothetical protein [Yersinia intermedia]|uniref:hypothetical protein n=1 Tax=Yersinia intermedia TaxID=631 RepID=UPI00065D3592|nr:hypothetical protein [Yersinia intermedia]CRY83956.1 RepFIB replication protein A [Yersinia intermedia]
MISAYSALLCDQMGSSVINDLLSLPKLVGAAAIKDALLILDSPSNMPNPRDGNTLNETPLQDIASGKELVSTFQQPIADASSSHEKSNIKKYKKTNPTKKSLLADEVVNREHLMGFDPAISYIDLSELDTSIPADGLMGNHRKLPANIQSHPLVLLRIPLFVAERIRSSRTDLTNEDIGKQFIASFERNGYEGFNSVSIVGPAMNSTHFLVWDAIIPCNSEQSKDEILKNMAVLKIKLSKFMDYLGVPAKYKSRDKKKQISDVIHALKSQEIVITQTNDKEYTNPIKKSVISLIHGFVFDEQTDEITISAGKSFFQLFGDHQLIPVDTGLIQSLTHEVERIAVIFLSALPTKNNKNLKLSRILDRVRPRGVARSGRERDLIIRLLERLKGDGRVDFTLDTSDSDFSYKDFSHNLQRSVIVKKVTLVLPRKPRADKLNQQTVDFHEKMTSWAKDSISTLHSYQAETGDMLVTMVPLPRLESLIEACEIIRDSYTKRFILDTIDSRRERRKWLSKK